MKAIKTLSMRMKAVVVTLLFVVSLFVSLPRIVDAQEVQAGSENLAVRIMDAYADAMLDGNICSFQDIMLDTSENSLFVSYLQWRYAAMEIMGDGYETYTYNITDIACQSADEMSIEFDEYFDYANIDDTGYSLGVVLHVRHDNGYILDITVENDDCYVAFVNAVVSYMAEHNASDNYIDSLVDSLYNLKDEMDLVCANQVADFDISTDIGTLSTSYSYSASRGVAYATTYVTSANSCFYSASADCTNFVSQCIWAAYGGWSSSMTEVI